MIASTFIIIFWAIFLIYWLISAISAKRNLPSSTPRTGVAIRLAVAVIIILLLRPAHHFNLVSPTSPILAVIGVILCGLGIALAIWARYFLGTNWGMPMSHKENPDLITSGPYHWIRHPIYTGMLLAMIGTPLAISLWLFLISLLFAIYFIYSAKSEEKLMLAQFPDAYQQYKSHTKMLIPFLY